MVSYADAGVVYAWSTPPKEMLVRSTDGGKTWTEVDTSAFQKSIFTLAADHQRANKIYAGVIDGIYVSEDYGSGWKKATSLDAPVALIVDDLQEEGVMYVSVAKKGLLKTNDGGKTWQNLNQGLPDPTEDLVVFLAANPHRTAELYALTKRGSMYRYENAQWTLFPAQLKHG